MNTDKVTVIVPNEKIARQFGETFKRIAGLMGAVKCLADVICEQNEEAPNAEEVVAKNLGPHLIAYALKVDKIYPYGEGQMTQDLEVVQSMLDNRHIRKAES